MKTFALLAASLAIPAAIASAQTTGTTTSSNGQIPYIPLIGSSAGGASTSTANNNSVWYLDTARNLVVLCSQVGGGSAGGTLSFSCTAQATPTTASSGSTGTSTPAGGSSSGESTNTGATGATGSSSTGGAGANPLTGS